MDSLDSQQISTLLRMLQGGGGGSQNSGIHQPSGLPEVPSESGLFNLLGLSGANDPSMSGSSARGSLGPGNSGGMSLADLNLMNAESAAGGDTSGSGVNLGSILQGIGGGIGQQGGGQLGFQTIGNTSPTGGSQPQGYTAGQTGNSTADPLAMIQKILGLAKTGVGIASPTQGGDSAVGLTQSDISGTSPEAQAAFAEQRKNERTASPYVTPSADLFAGIPIDQITAGLGFEPSALGTFGVPGGETAANTAGVSAPIGTGTSQSQNTLSGQGNNIGGAIGGGVGAAGGILSTLMANGNVPQEIAGLLQSGGGIAQLLKAFPDFSNSLGQSLGLGDIASLGSGLGNTSLLTDIGAGAQGLGGLLGIGTGIEGLVSGKGNPVAEGVQVGQGALATLQAANQLTPELVSAASEAIGLGAQGLSVAIDAAAPWLSVAAPVIQGLLGYMENQDRIQAERFGARKFRSSAGAQQNQVGELGGRLANLDVSQFNPAQQQSFLNAAAQDFQSIDPANQPMTGGITINTSPLQNAFAYLNAGANPSASDPTGTTNQAAANQYGKGLLSAYPGLYERMAYELAQNPSLTIPTMETGGRKTADIQGAAQAYGGTTPYESWYGALPGLPTPFVEGQPGGNYAQDVNPAIAGFISRDVAASPFYAQEYWQQQGVTPAEAFLYGAGNIGNGALGQHGLNLPGVSGNDYRAYDPGTLYQTLLGSGMPNLGGLTSLIAPPSPIPLSALPSAGADPMAAYQAAMQYDPTYMQVSGLAGPQA